jgi:hypothetical protein
MIGWHDRFCSDAAERAVLGGAAAVVFGAAGFPFGYQPHAAAAAASPRALFFYPDPDPVIVLERAWSLEGDWRARALEGTIRDPEALLAAVRAAGAVKGPVQVQFGLGAAYLSEGEPASLLKRYRRLLPSGSTVTIGIVADDEAAQFAKLTSARPYTAGDVAAWCAGAGLGLEGKPADVRAHGREKLGEGLRDEGIRIMAAVARKP